jgi:hypothetical protein
LRQVGCYLQVLRFPPPIKLTATTVFALIFFTYFSTCPKAKFRKKKSIYSNKFFHNFHLSESSFTCPRLRASGLAQRLLQYSWPIVESDVKHHDPNPNSWQIAYLALNSNHSLRQFNFVATGLLKTELSLNVQVVIVSIWLLSHVTTYLRKIMVFKRKRLTADRLNDSWHCLWFSFYLEIQHVYWGNLCFFSKWNVIKTW